MAVTLVPRSAAIQVTQRPLVSRAAVSGSDMVFTCSQNLKASGSCSITGDASDNSAGFTLGLIQLEWIETNWGHYRGQSNADGSCFLQRARPPARPAQGCRDTLTAGGIFVDNNPGLDHTDTRAGSAFPINLSAAFFDGPNDSYPLTRVNSLTRKINFLREVQLEFHFATVLTLRDPAGNFQHLKHFLWNVHWQAQFTPTNFANVAAAWTITNTGGPLGNTQNVSGIADGGPTERKFTSIITAGGAPNCNAVATAAARTPNTKESRTWTNFAVGF
jgi:hypothetical protein